MFTQNPAQPDFFPDFDRSEPHGLLVVPVAPDGIAQDVSQAAGHAGAKVHPGRTQNYGDARSHVFASMLAHAFDDSKSAAVPYREALSDAAGNIKFSAGRSVQQRVSRQHI